MDEQRFILLFERYLEDRLSPQELRELQEAVQDEQSGEWLDSAVKKAFTETASREDDADIRQAAFTNILSAIHSGQEEEPIIQKRRIIPYRWLSGVAAMLLLSIGASWFFFHHKPIKPQHQQAVINDIKPGVNQATLTLANGTKIILSTNLKGQLAQQAGVKVTKTQNGQLIYTIDNSASAAPIAYNTLTTARHEQYQVILPDSTHVWLNAASSLKYPLAFNGNERKVELTGEAYFEVAHNAAKPFKVKTATQEVEVLGTHFNIKAYEDERSVKTTLLQGSVRINNLSGATKLLKPGQQAVNIGTKLTVNDIDTEEAVAWKNGYFMFDNEDLAGVMRKISRWYDVDVVYQDPGLAKQRIGGSITRFANASEVLEMLHKVSGVHFKIEGRQITVTP